MKHSLRWSRHCIEIDNDRLCKQPLHGELVNRNQPPFKLNMRYKDCFRVMITAANISDEDCSIWKELASMGKVAIENIKNIEFEHSTLKGNCQEQIAEFHTSRKECKSVGRLKRHLKIHINCVRAISFKIQSLVYQIWAKYFKSLASLKSNIYSWWYTMTIFKFEV